MDIDRSARISGRPAIPPFQGGRSVIRLSLGKLLVSLLQVVKRTNTPLIPQQFTVPHFVRRLVCRVSGRCCARFKATHAQFDDLARNDSVAGNRAPGKSSRACIRSAIAAVSIKPSARSATPLNWGLSAVVNFCLMHRDLHRSPNFPPRNLPPPSDRTIITCEGTPSARVSARNCLNISSASDLWRIKYIFIGHRLEHYPLAHVVTVI